MAFDLTLDQARTLEAIARLGSAAKASAALRRAASAVQYQMAQLEAVAGVAVFDRSGYRTTLTPFGEGLLARCQPLLDAVGVVERYCVTSRLGYEPTLTIVYDGFLPASPILAAVRAVAREAPDTRVSLFSEYLGDVEVRAHATHADLAIAVVPFAHPIGPARPLPPIDSVLVVAASHPLASLAAEAADGAAWLAELARHPLLTVRGSDPRLGLLPADFKPFAELRLPDFAAKREALLAAMGWGWMPRSRVAEGLADASLVHLTPPEASGLDAGRHAVIPRLHVRHDDLEGRASRAFVAGLTRALS